MVSLPEAFSFGNKSGETLVKQTGTINGQVFYLQSLQNCEVYLLDISSAIYADDLKGCKIYIGPVNGSFKISNSENCEVSVAAQQFRTKSCTNITTFLYSVGEPHIELSTQMCFAPYNFAYPNQNLHFQRVGFQPQKSEWSKVYDHNPQPGETHYTIMESADFYNKEYSSEGGIPVNPVYLPLEYVKDEEEGHVSLDSINIGVTVVENNQKEDPQILIPSYTPEPEPVQKISNDSVYVPQFQPKPVPSTTNTPTSNYTPMPLAPPHQIESTPQQKQPPPNIPVVTGSVYQPSNNQQKQPAPNPPVASGNVYQPPNNQNPALPSFGDANEAEKLAEGGHEFVYVYRHEAGFVPLTELVQGVPIEVVKSTVKKLNELVQPINNQLKDYRLLGIAGVASFFVLMLFFIFLLLIAGQSGAGIAFNVILLLALLGGTVAYVVIKSNRLIANNMTAIEEYVENQNDTVYSQRRATIEATLETFVVKIQS